MEQEQVYKEMLLVVAKTGLSVEEAYREIVNGFSSWYLSYAYRSSNRAEIGKMPLNDVL